MIRNQVRERLWAKERDQLPVSPYFNKFLTEWTICQEGKCKIKLFVFVCFYVIFLFISYSKFCIIWLILQQDLKSLHKWSRSEHWNNFLDLSSYMETTSWIVMYKIYELIYVKYTLFITHMRMILQHLWVILFLLLFRVNMPLLKKSSMHEIWFFFSCQLQKKSEYFWHYLPH